MDVLDRKPDVVGRLLRQIGRESSTEYRAFARKAEFRAAADGGSLLFSGYPCVTNAPYDVYGGPANGGWSETVERGAFNKTLAEHPDVNFLINHEGMSLARTKSGTLRLSQDTQGLWCEADLSPESAVVRELQIAMDRGDIDEMSFAFRVIRQVWLNADGDEVAWWDPAGIDRRILEVSLQKGDVSAVNYGANPATSGSIRAFDAAFAELRSGRTLSKEKRDLILIAIGDLSIEGGTISDSSTRKSDFAAD